MDIQVKELVPSSIQNELAKGMHPSQGVGPGGHPSPRSWSRVGIQNKELDQGMHQKQGVGNGDASKTRSWSRACIQIKDLPMGKPLVRVICR